MLSDTSVGGQASTKPSDTNVGGQASTKPSNSNVGGQAGTEASNTNVGGQGGTKPSNSTVGGQPSTEVGNTNVGGQVSTKPSNTSGGQSSTGTTNATTGGQDVGTGTKVSKCDADQAATSNGTCVQCRNCTAEGENLGHESTASKSGHCICKTQTGYYYNDSSSGIGTYPCDLDGDGWVSDAARFAIESQDPVVSANARCSLHTISNIILINDDGDRFTIPILPPLPLYESKRNDEQTTLDGSSSQVPTYGVTGRALKAVELNSFTKACVSANADHNDNLIADVAEWGRPSLTSPSQAESSVSQSTEGRAPFVDQYTRYSYFVELNLGYYGACPSDTSAGCYYIQEKTRKRNQLDPEPVIYGSLPDPEQPISDLWQTCPRGRDTWYDPKNTYPPIGMDFASVSGPFEQSDVWHGMMHHSQFKCVDLVDEDAYKQLVDANQTLTAPQKQTKSSVDASHLHWQLNSCVATGTPKEKSDGNPIDPTVTCEAVADTSTLNADVTWAAARFDPPESYRRSCILTCEGAFFYCPGGSDATASCFTLCGNFAATSAGKLTGGGYTLVGEVPANGIAWPKEMMLGTSDGYSVQPQLIPGQ